MSGCSGEADMAPSGGEELLPLTLAVVVLYPHAFAGDGEELSLLILMVSILLFMKYCS